MVASMHHSESEFGIRGYSVPKAGLMHEHPKYSYPKEKNKNFLDQVKKRSQQVPAPNSYHKAMSWNNPRGKFLLGKKKTTIDANAQLLKYVPGPGAYKPKALHRYPLGFQT